jgi:hypothetical protein
MMRLRKGKRGADYMGHRLFKDGSTAMFCKKTETLSANLPATYCCSATSWDEEAKPKEGAKKKPTKAVKRGAEDAGADVRRSARNQSKE